MICTLLVSFCILLTTLEHGSSSSHAWLLSSSQRPSWPLETTSPAPAAALISQATQLSQQGQVNVTAAHEAADLWKQLLPDNDVLPPAVAALCWTLYAHTLVRGGREVHALMAWDKALELADQDPSLLLGKAASCQRLLRYDEALDLYKQAGDTWGAFVCAMRMGTAANEAVEEILFRDLSSTDRPRIHQAREVWRLLTENQLGTKHPKSPVAAWLLHIAHGNSLPPRQQSLESMVQSNVGPWDDYLLTHLDDKVYLHQLLAPYTPTFWPRGYIWPDDKEQFQNDNSDRREVWICKDRAGYGSHGNTVRNAAQILELDNHDSSQFLVQERIDPPLLINQCVFSLRIYVVYFVSDKDKNAPEYYVSRQGLVKLASQSYHQDDHGESTASQYWTNSGSNADNAEQQMEMEALYKYMPPHVVDDIWQQIDHAVDDVMETYQRGIVEKAQPSSLRTLVARAGLPKIMGWDFMVDANHKVWLLEVNRFPGMDPRNKQDATVKRLVLEQAWTYAAERLRSKQSHIDMI